LPKKQRSLAADTQPGVVLAGVGGFIVGLIIALPPFTADASWRTAMSSGNAENLQAAALKFPIDSNRLANAALVFENNKLSAQALVMARKGIEHNPDYFDAWRVLSTISQSTPEEKTKALEMMHKLDPRNKELK
jgi:hypothetical protein